MVNYAFRWLRVFGNSLSVKGSESARSAVSPLLQSQRQLATKSSLFQFIPDSNTSTGPPAFVFDIDGVLVRGKNVLSAARQAMQQLTHSNGQLWKYPVCFMTNGGGVTEAAKAQQLSEWLGVRVHADQVILSHTPMRGLVSSLADLPVLVSGRKDELNVARTYGFNKVLTTRQLGAAYPTATPFSRYSTPSSAQQQHGDSHKHRQEHQQHHQHQQQGLEQQACPVRDLGYATDDAPIAAVLVMNDPDDWYRDLQLITDVILTRGVPTRLHTDDDAPPVKLFFSNPDLLWANEFPRPRYGQGAFSTALNALHIQLTGNPLQQAVWYGKPNPEPYRLAEQLLLQQAQQMSAVVHSSAQEAFCGIFMVGDNPAADIRGANRAGSPWVSMLVRTGVYQERQQLQTSDEPQAVVDDVLGAVQAALHRWRQAKWHVYR